MVEPELADRLALSVGYFDGLILEKLFEVVEAAAEQDIAVEHGVTHALVDHRLARFVDDGILDVEGLDQIGVMFTIGIDAPNLFEFAIERPFPDPGDRVCEIAENFDLVITQITEGDDPLQGFCGSFRRRLFEGRFRRREIDLEFVGRTPMREAIDPHRAVRAAHDACFAATVVDTLERVGKRLAVKPSRVS